MVPTSDAPVTSSTCPKCGGFGGDRTELDEYAIPRMHQFCDCQRGQDAAAYYAVQHGVRNIEEKSRRIARAFGSIPERYLGAKIEDFTEAAQRATAETARAAADEGKSVLIYGTVGNGKTHLAVALLYRALDRGVPGLFVTSPDLLEAIRSSFDGSAETENVNELARTIPFLLLDDVGTEKVTGWVQERLYMIVNHRYNNKLQTVVTTNKTEDELSDHIGDPIVSRLVGMAEPEPLEFVGKDRRLRYSKGTNVNA